MILPIHGALAKMAQTPWAVDHKRLSGPVQISRFPREDLDQDLRKSYLNKILWVDQSITDLRPFVQVKDKNLRHVPSSRSFG